MTRDVVTIGEAMLRLSPTPGVSLTRADRLDVHVAGSEANVAVALASLGRSVSWISRLPDSRLGRRVTRDLRAAGVEVDGVDWDPQGRLGTYFVELDDGPRGVSIIYDRQGSSFAALNASHIPWATIQSARLVHLSGITPALSTACRETVLEIAERVRDTKTLLSVDVNHRARLWSSEEAGACIRRLARGADLLLCTSEDAEDLFGVTGEPEEMANSLSDLFDAPRVVVTLGADGCVMTANGETARAAARPTRVVDRLGAGDAFVAGVIDGLLDGDIRDGLERGAVLAAVALATSGDQVALSRSELDSALAADGRRLDR